jgi:DNA polymerase III delta prime subunit
MSITTPQERQAQSSSGLRDRLFSTLDAVIAGDIDKEQVEAVCYVSQEILKSAKVDLEFEAMAQERLKLQHKLEREKNEGIALLSNVIEESIEAEVA